ncbi:MAG: glycosyltransferase [Methanomassiliicoccales archaeon]
MKVNIYGSFAGPGGYNIHAREFTRAMANLNEVSLFSLNGLQDKTLMRYNDISSADLKGAPSITIAGVETYPHFTGKQRIGCTVWETTKIPPHWVHPMNQLDEVWASSQWGAEIMRRDIDTNVFVLPQGVHPAMMNGLSPLSGLQDDARFRFCSVFKWEKRKGPDRLLQAFCEEFSPDEPVDLVLQAFNHHLTTPEKWKVERYAQLYYMGVPSTCHVSFVDYLPSFEDLARFYCSCDAFVLPTRGEGWCSPALEAMCCGLPTIITDFGGQKEFCDGSAHLVKVEKMTPAGEAPFIPFYDGSYWAEASIEDLRRKMRYVVDHGEKERERAELLAAELREKYSWAHCAQNATARLRELA